MRGILRVPVSGESVPDPEWLPLLAPTASPRPLSTRWAACRGPPRARTSVVHSRSEGVSVRGRPWRLSLLAVSAVVAAGMWAAPAQATHNQDQHSPQATALANIPRSSDFRWNDPARACSLSPPGLDEWLR